MHVADSILFEGKLSWRPGFRSAWVLFAIAACASQPVPSTPSGEPTLEVARVMPSPEDMDSSVVEVTLALTNASHAPIEVAGVEYRLDTQGVLGVISGEAESSGTIDAGQRAEIKFRETIVLPEDTEAYRSIVTAGVVPLVISGTVNLKGGSSLSFEKTSEMTTPVLPRVEVSDAQAARYGEDGLDVTMYLRLINDNPFPIAIQNLNYTVLVDDKKIRSENAAVGQRLVANSAEEYYVSKTIAKRTKDVSDKELKKIIERGKIDYRIEGKIDLAKISIPVELTGSIVLGAGGGG